jgi:hypothetical protein
MKRYIWQEKAWETMPFLLAPSLEMKREEGVAVLAFQFYLPVGQAHWDFERLITLLF